MRALDQVLDAVLGEAIWDVGQAFDRRAVNAVFDVVRADACQNGMCGRAVEVRGGQAVGIESSAEADGGHRSIPIVAYILFTGPDQLHRLPAQGFGHCDGLSDVVGISTPTKAPTQETIMDVDILQRYTSDLGGG